MLQTLYQKKISTQQNKTKFHQKVCSLQPLCLHGLVNLPYKAHVEKKKRQDTGDERMGSME